MHLLLFLGCFIDFLLEQLLLDRINERPALDRGGSAICDGLVVTARCHRSVHRLRVRLGGDVVDALGALLYGLLLLCHALLLHNDGRPRYVWLVGGVVIWHLHMLLAIDLGLLRLLSDDLTLGFVVQVLFLSCSDLAFLRLLL